MDLAARLNLLSEDDYLRAATALEAMQQSDGWKYYLQLIESSRQQLLMRVRDPDVKRGQIIGALEGLEGPIAGIGEVMKKAEEIRAQRKAMEKPDGDTTPSILPFVRRGGGSPAL